MNNNNTTSTTTTTTVAAAAAAKGVIHNHYTSTTMTTSNNNSCSSNNNKNNNNDSIISSRWIWIREMKRGVSRYYVTDAFERDIASYTEIETVYRENKQSVADIWLLQPEERSKHTKAFAHQISRYSTSDTPYQSTILHNVKVHFKREESCGNRKVIHKNNNNNKTPHVMNQISCLAIMDLDWAYYFTEYVMSEVDNDDDNDNNDHSKNSSLNGSNNNNNNRRGSSKPSAPKDLPEIPFLDLDDLSGDEDFNYVLGLLE